MKLENIGECRDTVYALFGITKERAEELRKYANFISTRDYSTSDYEIAIEAIEFCVDINEIAYLINVLCCLLRNSLYDKYKSLYIKVYKNHSIPELVKAYSDVVKAFCVMRREIRFEAKMGVLFNLLKNRKFNFERLHIKNEDLLK